MKKLLFVLLLAFFVCSANALVYNVRVPNSTHYCYIAGEMTGWNQQFMTKVDSIHYTIDISTATILQKYKYCSGPGWGYVEKAADGSEIPDRSYSTSDVVLNWAAIYDWTVPDAPLQYNVTVPAGTKNCYIAGGWNGWASFLEMTKVDSIHYTIIIVSNKGLKYKYSSGPNWSCVELDSSRNQIPDRTYAINDEVINWSSVWDPNLGPVVSAGIIMRYPFTSQYVDKRIVDVWLPQGYTTEKKYAVLYMHDGQNLFDKATSVGVEWQVDEMATTLVQQQKIRDCIVVGIWNTTKRYDEYFPEKTLNYLPVWYKNQLINNMGGEPKGDNYLKFIVNELKPFIDSTFSTYTDQQSTYIGGSSMGGLISWYAVCEYPQVFSGAACLSTHWAENSVDSLILPDAYRKYLSDHLPSPSNHKFYFDHGTLGLDTNYAKHQILMDTIMKFKGYNSKNWISKIFVGDTHSEADWSKRLNFPLEFLLSPQSINSLSVNASEELKIYPNPAHNILTIDGLDVNSPNSISIYNIYGIIQIREFKLTEKKIDISKLPIGIYLLEINGQTRKITKY
jgi:hypothetical protein